MRSGASGIGFRGMARASNRKFQFCRPLVDACTRACGGGIWHAMMMHETLPDGVRHWVMNTMNLMHAERLLLRPHLRATEPQVSLMNDMDAALVALGWFRWHDIPTDEHESSAYDSDYLSCLVDVPRNRKTMTMRRRNMRKAMTNTIMKVPSTL